MPTYDYECSQCGRVFEVFQNMSDDPIETCDHCGASVRRLIGGGLGIIFKGSGFYVTDNKSGSKGAGTRSTVTKENTGDTSGGGDSKKETSSASAGATNGDSAKTGGTGDEKPSGTAVKPGKA
jgi:putative FmdB family regulatory protein